MHKRKVKVWVQHFADRKNLMLQWNDPLTGKRKSKTAGTANRKRAEQRAIRLEAELNLAVAEAKKTSRPKARDDWKTGFGCVYLATDGQGFFKIGESTNPIARVAELNVGSPRELVLVHTIFSKNPRWLEKEIHKMFSTKNVRGEWFSLDEADVAELKTIAYWNRGEQPGRVSACPPSVSSSTSASPPTAPLCASNG